MKSRVIMPTKESPFSKAQRKEMKAQQEAERQENSAKNATTLKIVLAVFCWVLHKRYRYTTKTLQSIIDEAFDFIIEADSKNTDWAAGIKYWTDKMGLKI